MPSIGWTTKDGQNFSFEEALAIARKEGAFEKFPAPALIAMRNERDDYQHLSPSGATRCNRQKVLQAENDYWQDLEGAWPAFTGNAYHRELAHATVEHFGVNNHHVREERWMQMDLDVLLPDGTIYPFKMSGTPDLYDIDEGTLYDWKSVGDFVYYDSELKQKVTRVFPYPEHELQINLYALFMGSTIKRAFIWYVKSEGKKGVTRRLVPVELWDREDAYHTACELAVPLAWYAKTGELPQEVYDPSLWMCRACPVKAICQQLRTEGK